MSAGDRNLESAGANPTFVPSEAMVEAGARALCLDNEGEGWWERQPEHDRESYRRDARVVLVAACTATVTEPCPTCGPDGDYAVEHLDAAHRCPTSWAWLSPFLNAGMLSQAGDLVTVRESTGATHRTIMPVGHYIARWVGGDE